MIGYVITYVFVNMALFLSLLRKSFQSAMSFVLLVWIILFSGFRYGVGIDFMSYKDIFDQILTNPDLNIEAGFAYLNIILNQLGFNEQMLFLTVSISTLIMFYMYFKEFSYFPILSIYIFALTPLFMLASFNVIRQFMAISIFAFSIKYIVKSSFVKYFLLIITASCFYKTALLLLPLYFLLKQTPSVKSYILFLSAYTLSIFTIDRIVVMLGLSKIYLMSEYFNRGVDFKAYIYVVLFLLIFRYKHTIPGNPKNINVFINMIFISTMILLTPIFTSLPSGPVLRMASYFTIAIPILLANMVYVFNSRKNRLIYIAVIVLSVSLYFWLTIAVRGEEFKLVPYQPNIDLF